MLYVLAGVNGGGKSSLGGQVLREAGIDWFNPDDWSRALQAHGYPRSDADAAAWAEGQRRLKLAIASGRNYAFETTLGGRTVTQRLIEARQSHELLIWYVGLENADLHVARVALRVAHGGHSIPEALIHARHLSSMANLVRLIPHATAVQLYDNSLTVPAGHRLRPPKLLARIAHGRLQYPQPAQLHGIPNWAKPAVEAALEGHPGQS